MQYTADFLKKITSLGTLNYPLSKVINILDVEAADAFQFTTDFYNPASPVAIAYKKGIDKADYAIDAKLFELAKDGDKKALELYEERRYEQKKQYNTEKENNISD